MQIYGSTGSRYGSDEYGLAGDAVSCEVSDEAPGTFGEACGGVITVRNTCRKEDSALVGLISL